MEETGVCIVGAGPAALSAAVYLSRGKIPTTVIGIPSKSGAWYAHEIQNYLGFDSGISGKKFVEQSVKQAQKFGAKVLEEEVVHAVQLKNGKITIKTSSGKEMLCSNLVIASGKSYASSGVEGEEKFKGKGVHYCVACDGFFYTGRKVAVIGSGNFAAEEALELLAYTKDVTIVSNGKTFSFTPAFKNALEKNKIKTLNASVESFEGKGSLSGLALVDGKKMKFDGAFIAVGMASALAFANKLGLEMKGEDIVADGSGRTSVKGVFAAGACCGGYSQISKSVGDGCAAAITIIKELKGISDYEDHT